MQAETKAKIIGEIVFTRDGKQRITFECEDDLKAYYDEFNLKDLTLIFKPYSKRRTRTANAYLWELIGKLAECPDILDSRIDIYRKAVREAGVCRDMLVSDDSVKTHIHAWEAMGIGWFAEKVDDGDRDGFSIYRFYYGTSSYNTKQFLKILDYVKQDCENCDIPTATPDEEAEMLSRLNEKYYSERT